LPKSRCFDGPLLAPLPLPGECYHRPLAQLEGRHQEVLESIVAHQLGDRGPDDFLGAGPFALCSLPDGRLPLQQLWFGLPLHQVQRAYLRAIQSGAEAHQERAFGRPQFPLGPAVDFDPSAICKGQGLILFSRDLVEAAHPAGWDGRDKGETGLCEGLEVGQRDMALIQNQCEAYRCLLREALADHLGHAWPQGDHIRGMALIATGIEGQALFFLDNQSDRDLAQVRTLLLVFSPPRRCDQLLKV
jgi:hypothetical protein